MTRYDFERQYRDILASLEDGATVRTWHCKPTGSKGNDAFIISRMGNQYRAYCHHCTDAIVYTKTGSPNPYSKAETDTGKKRKVVLPKDSTGDISSWPVKGKEWFKRYLTEDEIKHHGICYSAFIDRIIIPIYMDGILVGYQGRDCGTNGPKWLTRKGNVDSLYYPKFSFPNSYNVVMVEDILSCIVVGRQFNCIAVLGTNIKDKLLHKIVSSYKNYTVWFDDDNPQVKMKQRKLRDRLSLYGPTRLITGIGRDPKELSSDEIRSILCPGK